MIQLLVISKPSNRTPVHLLYTIIYLNVKILLFKLNLNYLPTLKQQLNKTQPHKKTIIKIYKVRKKDTMVNIFPTIRFTNCVQFVHS